MGAIPLAVCHLTTVEANGVRLGVEQFGERVAVPADPQLKTMLDSGTFSLTGLRRVTRVPIERLGLAVASQLA